MLDLESTTMSSTEKKQLQHSAVGGVILFSRNYENPSQLLQLTESIKAINPNIIIAVDHEGGRVQRFRSSFSAIPPMACFEASYELNPQQTLADCETIGWLLAAELLVHHIDISFTPVLDRNYGRSSVIGDRAFSGNNTTIAALATALMKGMHKAGMAATGKHFPGHGAVVEDSHLDLPVDHRSLSNILEQDVPPFQYLIKQGLDAIMPAHILFDKVDEHPAGFSPFWLQNQLRGELGFNGVIFSDDLNMAGAQVAGSFTERAKAALSAGCDMVLVCNNPGGAAEVLGYLDESSIAGSERLLNILAKPMLAEQSIHDYSDLKCSDLWLKAQDVLNKYNS
jgi:beta-N-acetylhexosaminidase